MKNLLLVISFLFATNVLACDDKELVYKVCSSQKGLYETALKNAAANKKLVLATFGFETCPWCQSIHALFAKPESVEKLKPFEVVEIEGRDKKLDGKSLLDSLVAKKPGYKFEGYPFFIMVNPKNKKMEFIDTGALEQNTETTKGHSPDKVFAALNEAAKKLK